ncbi:Glycosyltransferase involved in cell wall bisynthesis [Cycloclasticus pugetii]|nr:Glycosyltransferase involved in cell wall bisynthesis [Cycloclasticus pugetii]
MRYTSNLYSMTTTYRLLTFFPNHITTYGIGHAALSIADAMNGAKFESVLVTSSIDKKIRSKIIKKLIPSLFMRGVHKLCSQKIIFFLTEFFFIIQIRKNDIIYLWPGASIKLFNRIKKKGNVIIIENINCHQMVSKKILDIASKKMHLSDTHVITEESIQEEVEKLNLCNYVYSPSPSVTKSLLVCGVGENKILESSYGLHQYQQFNKTKKYPDKNNPIEVIFVGRVGLRKGVHLLLEYWQEANIDGTLKIVGNIEESIKGLITQYQQRNDIQFIDFIADIDVVYKNADVFILPSLEEGSPLVTYAALGAGLPCIVSPMGGEGVVRHNQDGYVIDPHDKPAWVSALKQLAESTELRHSMSVSALIHSDTLLWKNVGLKRAELLFEKL